MTEELAYAVYEIDETVKLLTQLIEKDKNYSKEGTKIKTDFSTLKAKLVVTTGDKYVGSVEPQLREKMEELFTNIASNFSAPSATQLESLESVKQLFNSSLTAFKTFKTKNETSYLKKVKETNTPFVLKTFEEFTKK